MNIRPLIMCGGSGTRLWPASRDSFPKQFAPLVGQHSTFQDTVLRVTDAALFDAPLIVAAQKQRFTIERQLADIGAKADLLLEPMPRDSAPAIVAGALAMAMSDPRALVLVLAADHVVRDPAGFRATVAEARSAAEAGRIVTFGIEPTFPSTAYGYIEQGDDLPGSAHVRAVRRFVEKPHAAAAQQYLLEGYLWNSGNFLFRADVLLAEYARFAPGSLAAITDAVARARTDLARKDLGARVLDADAFVRAEKKSIDYAVMERTQLSAVVPGRFGWSDIGTWDALWDIAEKDEDGNVARGDVTLVGTRNTYAATDGVLVGVIGMEDTVVVATRDAVLVCSKSRAGDVKTLVDQLKARHALQATEHLRSYRPWGWRQAVEQGHGFLVRRLVVYPGQRLSLHRHAYRAEHWVVVKGTADVIVGEEPRKLSENQSIYIPPGQNHRLGNSGTTDIEIIEVATGTYLGEDDIVRLADDYDRL